ncbi:MAG: hypothetical protein WCE68_16640 [Anaerolineales bacterium]
MKTNPYPRKSFRIFGIAFLLVFTVVACDLPLIASPAPAGTPIIQTVVVTQEVTQVVTQIVDVPVTVTPTLTPVDTDTPTPTPTNADSPTITPTPEPAAITVLIHTQCLYGPDPAYISKYEILAGSQQIVIGRNQDSSWLYVQGIDHKNPCWVNAGIVKVNLGSTDDAPVTVPDLSPYSNLYPPPPAVSANRVGNDVTVFWLPVPMDEADYNGYLIEAWVCQGGQLVFKPQSYVTSFDKNISMMAVKFTDEPGCLEPSSARIYTVNKQGYSPWKLVLPWPAWPTPTPTLTSTP